MTDKLLIYISILAAKTTIEGQQRLVIARVIILASCEMFGYFETIRKLRQFSN